MLRKTVIITGATSGIGQAAAWELLQQGHHVVMLARNRDRALDDNDAKWLWDLTERLIAEDAGRFAETGAEK